MPERLQYALAEVSGIGNRSLGDKRVLLRQREQTKTAPGIVGRCLEKAEIQRVQYQHFDRETGVQ